VVRIQKIGWIALKRENSDSWFRLRIDDPALASSASFASLFGQISKHFTPSAIAVDRFEGVKPRNETTARLEDPFVVLSPQDLLQQLTLYTQLVWGRFFLLKYSDAVNPNMRLEEEIAASEATVCVADNMSYFVFTRSGDLVDDLLSTHEQGALANGDLSELLALPEEI
jgi:hypothetical protein